MDKIRRSILATILYFDVMDYPLTLVELSKWLWTGSESATTEALVQELNALVEHSHLETHNGFFFVPGRSTIIQTRLDRYRWALSKIVRAKQMLWWISLLPFVRGIALVNTLGFLHSRKEGDVDCLIIGSYGNLWACRLFTTGIIALLGLRPHEHQGQDALCFSFYLSDREMDLRSIALRSDHSHCHDHNTVHSHQSSPDDPYLVYWIASALSLYDSGRVFEKFHTANSWIGDYINSSSGRSEHPQWCIRDNGIRRLLIVGRSIVERILSLVQFEQFAQWYQRRRLPDSLKQSTENQSSGVIMNNAMLKFHNPDKREHIKTIWHERLTNL